MFILISSKSLLLQLLKVVVVWCTTFKIVGKTVKHDEIETNCEILISWSFSQKQIAIWNIRFHYYNLIADLLIFQCALCKQINIKQSQLLLLLTTLNRFWVKMSTSAFWIVSIWICKPVCGTTLKIIINYTWI